MRALRLALVASVAAAAGPAVRAGGVDQALTEAHNRLRGKHCAPPLRWSSRVAASAQRWANKLKDKGCVLQHSGGEYGENLAAGTQGAMGPEAVVDMWYGEAKAYSFHHGGFSPRTGHFTQLVWRGTTELGCGKTTCRGMDVWVCQYAPPGNVEGGYRDNVLPLGCAAR